MKNCDIWIQPVQKRDEKCHGISDTCVNFVISRRLCHPRHVDGDIWQRGTNRSLFRQ